MIVLGIETSCDETATAVVTDRREIRSDLVLSQLDLHAPYGGVVPEIAARGHIEHLDKLIQRALDEAGVRFDQVDGVAATAGPGLIGGLLVGLMMGKALAAVLGKPLIAVNHLEAHALTARLTDGIEFPYLLLLLSGGHCQLLSVDGVGRYRRFGTTIDDAIGEAFDKAAKMMGLGYPGGPIIEALAGDGDPARFDLPRPMVGRAGADFSFSGLKTALLRAIDRLGRAPTERDKHDLAAAFQAAVGDVVADRTANAVRLFRRRHRRARTLVVAGGVAANAYLRERLEALAESHGLRLIAPPPRLCTDNAAMVAWAGVERLSAGLVDPLDVPARARWPLDPAAAPARGAGVKA